MFKDTPGLTTLVVHDVEIGEGIPIKQHPYHLSPNRLSLVKQELKYMEESGVIEPGQSEWSSPIVLVPKPDGTLRFCVDYRKVNQVIKTDAFPIPHLEDCIDQTGNAQVVSKLYLLKGYFRCICQSE